MMRVTDRGDWEAVHGVLVTLPAAIRTAALEVDWVLRADPVFVGVHEFEYTGDGRSYRSTAHCAYGSGTRDGRTAIVLDAGTLDDRALLRPVVLHEVGHVVDSRLGFTTGFAAMTWYGETNDMEAFAECFQAWHTPPGTGVADMFVDRDALCDADPDAWTFFSELDRTGRIERWG